MSTYLVQRVLRRGSIKEEAGGVDRHFAFDYMGSAEFEFGALYEALKKFKRAEVAPTPIEIRHPTLDHVAYYVGSRETLYEATRFFEDQIQPKRADREIRLKERSELHEAYSGGRTKVIAWWAISASPPWLLFQHVQDAVLWLELSDPAFEPKNESDENPQQVGQ